MQGEATCPLTFKGYHRPLALYTPHQYGRPLHLHEYYVSASGLLVYYLGIGSICYSCSPGPISMLFSIYWMTVVFCRMLRDQGHCRLYSYRAGKLNKTALVQDS